jgi:hypothetical protein
MPWIFNEDSALKLKLQGLTVSDANSSSRSVPVRYRTPEIEVSDLTFPIIIIQHLGWFAAPERMHDGYTKLPYAPEGHPDWWSPPNSDFDPSLSPYYSWFPTPYNFDYQVTVYGRYMHEHMIPLIASLAQYDRLHARFGFLDIPQDGTKRTMQLLGGPELVYTHDSNDKRLFYANYRIRVFSELLGRVSIPAVVKLINLNIDVYTDVKDFTVPQLLESKALLSVSSPPIGWDTAQLYQ